MRYEQDDIMTFVNNEYTSTCERIRNSIIKIEKRLPKSLVYTHIYLNGVENYIKILSIK